MNAYNKMRDAYLTILTTKFPHYTANELSELCGALDFVSRSYDVKTKELALSTYVEPIPTLLKTYIAVKKTEGLSDLSLQNYARVLIHFFRTVAKPPEEVTSTDIRMYLYEYSMRRKVSNSTLDKYRALICWFFGWAYSEEYLTKNPARTIKAIKTEYKERQALSQLELEYLRMACKTVRDKAVLEFLYSTGCRVSELINVTKDDVNWNNNTVHLFGKGRKHRTSYLNAKALVALKAYLDSRKDKDPHLFVSLRAPYHPIRKEAVEEMFRKLSKSSGLSKIVTPHIIRHTTATQAVNSGMPIEDVSKLLGHASISTTMIYAKPAANKIHAEHTRCVI